MRTDFVASSSCGIEFPVPPLVIVTVSLLLPLSALGVSLSIPLFG